MLIKFTIITLFPEALQPYLDSSMLYKAQDRGIIGVEYVNLRDFGLGPHKSVDDTPYGGGDGMLLRPEPVFAAVESIKKLDPEAEVILPTPVGMIWNQALAQQFAGVTPGQTYDIQGPEDPAEDPRQALQAISEPVAGNLGYGASENQAINEKPLKTASTRPTRHFIIICPHYEGYDERILALVDHQISLGRYVLTGGELPALIIIDSITRLLPGVLGGASSAEIESFSEGDNLEYPQYTKPAEFRGMKVPEVLLSGHHGKIAQWRAEQSAKRSTQQ